MVEDGAPAPMWCLWGRRLAVGMGMWGWLRVMVCERTLGLLQEWLAAPRWEMRDWCC